MNDSVDLMDQKLQYFAQKNQEENVSTPSFYIGVIFLYLSGIDIGVYR